MKRPCSSSDATARSSQGGRASATMASAATQFDARIATSIVHAQFGPNSTGLPAMNESS